MAPITTGEKQVWGNSTNIKIIVVIVISLILGGTGCNRQTTAPVTLTMVAGTVGNEFEVLKTQVAEFEAARPDIRVRLIDLPESTNDRRAAIVNRFQAKDPTIDIYMVDMIWTPEFGAAGWTLPLDSYLTDSGIVPADFLSGPIRGNTWDGQLVSMPWFTDAGLLYYRADLLTKYGFSPPQTWAELVTIAQTIVAGEQETTPNIAGFVFQGRQYEGLVTNYLEYLWGNGGAVLNPAGNQVLLNSPAAVEALEIFSQMQTIAPPGITSFQEADALNYFQSGNAVFMRNWPFAWAVLNQADSQLKEQVGIVPLPHGPNGQENAGALGGWQLGISAYSQHPSAAFALIAFLTNPEQQAYKAIHAGQAPTRWAAYQNPDVLAANPHFADLFNVLVSARPRPVHPRYIDISTVIQQEVYRTLTGQQTAATATAAMTEAIQGIISSPTQEKSP